jgi:TPR repeat protein
MEWFRKAADQGMIGSLTTMARMYKEGLGVEQDLEEAQRLYREAGFDDF